MNRHVKVFTSTVVFGSWFAINVASAAPATPNRTIILQSDTLGNSSVSSYQIGAGLGVSSPRGGDRTVSEPSVSELTLTRYTDSASPLFFRALTTGDPIGDVVITDGALSMELQNVIISGYSLSASDTASPQQSPQVEAISLNFTRIIYSVAQGVTCYDLEENQVGC